MIPVFNVGYKQIVLQESLLTDFFSTMSSDSNPLSKYFFDDANSDVSRYVVVPVYLKHQDKIL